MFSREEFMRPGTALLIYGCFIRGICVYKCMYIFVHYLNMLFSSERTTKTERASGENAPLGKLDDTIKGYKRF